MSAASSDTLACGRAFADVLEQVADAGAPDAHQAQCPHCQATVTELSSLWQGVREVADEDVRAPEHLVQGVMRQLRELVPDDWYAALAADGGRTQIAVRALARIATRAAQRVPGVVVALGRRSDPAAAARTERDTLRHQSPGSAVGVAGASVAMDLAVVVQYDRDVRAIARDVRRAVRRDTASLTGLTRVAVNVIIDDVVVPDVAPSQQAG